MEVAESEMKFWNVCRFLKRVKTSNIEVGKKVKKFLGQMPPVHVKSFTADLFQMYFLNVKKGHSLDLRTRICRYH